MTQETLQLANKLAREISKKTDSYNDLTNLLNGIASNMMWLSTKSCYSDNSSYHESEEVEIPKELMIEAIKKSIVYYEEEIDKLQKQLDKL